MGECIFSSEMILLYPIYSIFENGIVIAFKLG